MMLLMGLRLSLRGGREALIRLALIASAVAVGITVLLSVLAAFHGFQATNNRQCWQCTTASVLNPTPTSVSGDRADAELWNYGEDFYRGHAIDRLDVAALGPHAPVVPGLSRLPGPGEYFASPALARLLDSVPRTELGDRFPGSRAGVIGEAALSGPDDLTIIIGYPPQQLAALPATKTVTAIATKPRLNSASNLYQFGFGMAAIGLVFPVLTLIGMATRLAAARREERFAAFRLVGATSRQVNIIASVDAVVAAVGGTVLGIGIFQLVRPAVAQVGISGSRYFSDLVAPTMLEYAAVLIGVPVAAAGAALWSLRRVRISPLGASRRTTPPAPTAWRLIPLLIGVAMFTAAPILVGTKPSGPAVQGPVEPPSHAELPFMFLGALLIMLGLVTSGSWLTMQASRLVARTARGAPGLLSARRLADNPKAAFRSVSGLVLAVFVGTAIAGLLPALTSGMQRGEHGTLNDVLHASFTPTPSGPGKRALSSSGLSARTGAELLGRLRSYPGVATLAVYTSSGAVSCGADDSCAPAEGVVGCKDLERFAALGRCAPGTQMVDARFGAVLTVDNPLALSLPIVDNDTPAAAGSAGLAVGAVLIRTDDLATLEKIRTLLTSYTARSGSITAPQTFGEVAHTRAVLYDEIEQVTLAVVVVTLFVAGCSLAVAVGGSLLERKRPFTLLRLTGTPTPTLYRVILLESALPLLLAAVVAAAAGFGAAASMSRSLATNGVSIALPGQAYFLTVGGGLIASLAVIATALPLLKRITEPNNARFE
jgi:hypothetical protein